MPRQVAGRDNGSCHELYRVRFLDDGDEMWLAPGGLLTHVPFAALLDRRERALVDRVDLRMLVTTAQLTRLPRRQRRRSSALVLRGDDEAAVPLPHADGECREVMRQLTQAGVHVGLTVDDKTLADADVLHYAGHARVDPNAGEGWLALPGRVMSTSDFAGLPLHRRPLVVLSACESAATAEGSDGLTGFIRAAFAAGARNVVCSGWLADDESTRHLMVEFYRRLGLGDEPARALRVASIATREARPEWAHPFFWANFRCYGHG